MKKRLTAAISFVLALSVTTASTVAYAPNELSTETDNEWGYDIPIAFGDANGDNWVDIRDFIRLKKYLTYRNTEKQPIINFSASDYNADGTIDSTDITAMRRQLLTAKVNCYSENSVGTIDENLIDRDSLVTYTPEVTTELLKNPGKGWVVYGDGNKKDKPFSENQISAWDYASVGYIRYSWSKIEPEEGKFDWDYIDNAISECKKHNARLAFGIMSADPTSTEEYITPKWVFDAGVKSCYSEVNNSIENTAGTMQYIPDFSDEKYIEKVTELAEALAKRYGGSRDIEFIDIRCYGSWGENNFYDIKELFEDRDDTGVNSTDMWNCWQTYINAFKNTGTRLTVAYSLKNNALRDVFEKAIAAGVALRNDGMFHWNTNNCGETNLWAVNKVPSVLEFAASYGVLKKKGSWNAQKFLESAEKTRTSYYPLGGAWETDAGSFISEQKSVIEEMSNKIGYHFTLSEIKVSKTTGSGSNDALIMKWLNSGNAPIFTETHLAAALLDKSGNPTEICWLDGADMSSIIPKTDVAESDGSVSIASPLRFNNPHSSDYRLAIGIFTSKNISNPDIKIGNANRTENGWVVIS